MGMTAAEKIFAKYSGKESVKPGDIVYPEPDLVFVHDGYIADSRKQLDALGIREVFDNQRVVLVTDHAVVYTTPFHIERGRQIRQAATDWGIKNFFDVGRGGHGHIFPMERGMILPGMFGFANDPHCSNFGAIGALVMRTGTEILTVLATGTLWMQVPATIRVLLRGSLPPSVLMRDFGYRLAADLRRNRFGVDWDYRVLEFASEGTTALSLDARVAAINTVTEIGVANVFFEPSNAIIEQAGGRATGPFEPIFADDDAEYDAEIAFDLSTLAPQVCKPGRPDNAVDIDEIEDRHVDHVFLGSCGSSMYEDMVVAADVLRHRKVAAGTRMFVTPGTPELMRRMSDEGILDVFQSSGVMVLPAGCGPCAGGLMAPLASGEVSICTAATNSAGRMGAADADIYLASPLTVAVSAVTGRITDPRRFDFGKVVP